MCSLSGVQSSELIDRLKDESNNSFQKSMNYLRKTLTLQKVAKEGSLIDPTNLIRLGVSQE